MWCRPWSSMFVALRQVVARTTIARPSRKRTSPCRRRPRSSRRRPWTRESGPRGRARCPARRRTGAVARPVSSSHPATDAFNDPVTGSSTVEPSFGEERPQLPVLRPARPDDAEVEVDEAGLERQHRVRARAAAPPSTPARCRPTARRRSSVARDPQDVGGVLDVGLVDRAGADQRRRGEREHARRRAPARARRRTPAARPRPSASPPASSHAWQVPSVGWPANGSSWLGVKIRTR